MYVKCQNPATRRLKVPGTDEYVEFDEDGRARCKAEHGRILARNVGAVEIDEIEENSEPEDDGEEAEE